MVTLSTFTGALSGGLGGYGSATCSGRFRVALDENGPNHLVTTSVSWCDVEQLICSFRQFMAQIMNQGATCRAILECRDDVGVGHNRKLVALLLETLDVISEGFTLLLPTFLQIPGVAWMHVCALKVASEELLEILPAIDDVSWQMIQPGLGGISQVDQEELDDERVIICSARSTHEVVILQLDTRVGFAIILDKVT
jgi:hypothetical protein